MKHDFLSDVERDYLKRYEVKDNQFIEVEKEVKEEYIDYTEEYDDFYWEELKKRKEEERQKWYKKLRDERFSHDDKWWKERKSTIKTMVEEGILPNYNLHHLEVIDNIYQISKIC